MKKLLFVFISIFTFICSHAVNVIDLESLTVHAEDSIPGYDLKVEKTDMSYILTYTFNSIAMINDEYTTGSYYLALDGFSLIHESAQPRLPLKLEQILIPNNVEYFFTILEEEFAEVPLKIAPAVPDVTPTTNADPEIVSIPLMNDYIPLRRISGMDEQIYRNQRILKFIITPISYNSVKGRIRVCKKFSFRIDFESANNEEPEYRTMGLVSTTGEKLTLETEKRYKIAIPLRDMEAFEIPVDSDVPYQSDPYEIGYLIVTDVNLLPEVERFAEWKQKRGFKTHIITINAGIKDRKEFIQKSIKEYCAENENVQYLLLFGDVDMIPSFETKFTYNRLEPYTDIYYACLDGESDYTPDLYYGRIPAINIYQAKYTIDKIIAYEEGAIQDGVINHIATSCYFQEDTEKGFYDYERYGFCYTSETIASAAIDKGNRVTRMYYLDPWVKPTHWSRFYANSEEIPSDINNSTNFSSSFNSKSVIDVINEGVSIFFHCDHGGTTGWWHPDMHTKDIDSLNNSNYPIMFSIDCLTGDFKNPDCFASNLLWAHKKGCSAVIAATEETYCSNNDCFAMAMFKSLWNDADIKYKSDFCSCQFENISQSYTIGEMFNIGQIQRENCFPSYSEEPTSDYFAYHIFGDPSQHVYWNESIDIESKVEIKKDKGRRYLYIHNMRDAIVSFSSPNYDFTGMKQYFVKGNKINLDGPFLSFNDAERLDNLYVTINARGAKPYSFYVGDWLREYPTGLVSETPDIKISKCSIENNLMTVEFDGEICDNLSIVVTAGSVTSLSSTV